MNLEDALKATDVPALVSGQDKPKIPKAGDPGTYEWDGSVGVVNTQPLESRPETWDAYLIDAGLNPETVEVIEPVQVRGWDAIKKEWNSELEDFQSNVVKMHYYSLRVRQRRAGPSVDELIAVIEKHKKVKKKSLVAGDHTYVVALGDLQLGKIDGDGSEGTFNRVVNSLDMAAERLKLISKRYPIETVHVAWLGDCIEGFVSQNGANAQRTTMSLTEQIRVLRRLMTYSFELFYPISPKLVEVSIPGNHDEAVRFQNKGVTSYDDSHDVEALVSVKDAIKLVNRMSSKKIENVFLLTPAKDELTVTVETSNTIIAHAHGHKFRGGKPFEWWKGQSFGNQPAGQADILLAGHKHHLHIEQSGPRTFIQVPAMESESTWYRHVSGETGNPGLVTLLVKDHKISELSIL